LLNITAIFEIPIRVSGYATSVKHIRDISEEEVIAFDATHYSEMFTMCRGLESVHLTGCEFSADMITTEAFITRLGRRCRRLTSLTLAGCLFCFSDDADISLASVRVLGQSCPSLTYIDLYGCRGISEEAMIARTEGCPDLTSIYLKYTDVREAAIVALSFDNLI
jgi:hypothetical protein